MFRVTFSQFFLKSILSISKPPVSGYEITELPNERILRQFMQYYKTKAVLLVVHSSIEARSSNPYSSLTVSSSSKEAVWEEGKDGRRKGDAASSPLQPSASLPETSTSSSSLKLSSPAQHSNRDPSNSADKAFSYTDPSPSGASSAIAIDPLLRTFVSSMNAMNFGHPDEVKIALVPGKRAPTFVRDYQVITYPTTLLFFDGQFVDRCVGARTRELSIKSLFLLRNRGRNIFARGDS